MALIDRNALRETINEYALPYKDNRLESANDMYYRIIHLLEDAPAVDAEPVRHGKWIDVSEPDENGNVQCKCSECFAGDTHSKSMIVPHCWRCGAKMEGD